MLAGVAVGGMAEPGMVPLGAGGTRTVGAVQTTCLSRQIETRDGGQKQTSPMYKLVQSEFS